MTTAREALEEAQKAMKLLEDLTACGADDDYVSGVQKKIADALAGLPSSGDLERFRDALERIALLDEADGHELSERQAFEAVAIAASTLGKHPSEVFFDRRTPSSGDLEVREALDTEGALDKESARANAHLIAAAPDLYWQLKNAIEHIEHMAKWIGDQKAGYSFEGLGEDMPSFRAALAKARGEQ